MTEPTHPQELPRECAQTRERLARDVDAQLDPSERVAMQLHLQNCEGCAEIAGWIRDVDGIAAAAETPPQPEAAYFDALSERVMLELHAKETARAPRPWAGWLRWAPSLVAFAAVAMIVGVISRRQIQETPQLETVANRPIETMARSAQPSGEGTEKPASSVDEDETVLETENDAVSTSRPVDELRAPALSRQEVEEKKFAASPPPDGQVYLREQSPAPAADADHSHGLAQQQLRGGRGEATEKLTTLGSLDSPRETALEDEVAVALDDQGISDVASGAIENASDPDARPDELSALLAEGQGLALRMKSTRALLSQDESVDARSDDTLGKNEERAVTPRRLEDVAAEILVTLRSPSYQAPARANQPAPQTTQWRNAARTGRRRDAVSPPGDDSHNEISTVPSLEDSLASFLRAALDSIQDPQLRAELSAWLEERERE